MNIQNLLKLYSCPVCDTKMCKRHQLCDACLLKITEYNQMKKCVICGRTIEDSEVLCDLCDKIKPKFDIGISVFSYKDKFKDAFLQFKFHHEFSKVKLFSQLMADSFRKLNVAADYIVYVPTNMSNIVVRGYNSSLELANLLSKNLSINLLHQVIIKRRKTAQQSTIEISKRYENIKDAFKINKRFISKIANKDILIVDDVHTTGATLSECAKELKDAGARSVYFVAFLNGAYQD